MESVFLLIEVPFHILWQQTDAYLQYPFSQSKIIRSQAS